MANPFLRPEERSHETPGRTPGVLVVLADGRRFLFPGGTYDLAMILANKVVGEKELASPDARVEWGYRDHRNAWVCEKKYKVPVSSVSPQTDPAEQGWG